MTGHSTKLQASLIYFILNNKYKTAHIDNKQEFAVFKPHMSTFVTSKENGILTTNNELISVISVSPSNS